MLHSALDTHQWSVSGCLSLFPCPVWEPFLRKWMLLFGEVSKCWFGAFLFVYLFPFPAAFSMISVTFLLTQVVLSERLQKINQNRRVLVSSLSKFKCGGLCPGSKSGFSAGSICNRGEWREQQGTALLPLIWLDNTWNNSIAEVKMLRVTRRGPVQMNSACCSFPLRFSNLQMG